ncbi:MAG: helix-turn-helix transcriptional regulator [Chloroflexota bacterium]
MDDQRLGLAFRRVRLRLGWRQQDVADRAGISRSAYSRIERGHVERVSIALLRRVGVVLEMRIEVVLRWRGAALDGMLAAGHARMHEQVSRVLGAAGWTARPEVSFSHFGERGVVDIVAWHAGRRTVLIVELKTQIVDIGDLLATMDRRRRLAAVIVAPFGWEPAQVGSWVVVTDTRTNRRRLSDHRSALRSAFPQDGRAVEGWLARPSGPIAALSFLTDETPTSTRQTSRASLRVPTRGTCTRGRTRG